jgi:hypothetical protein
MVVDMLSIRINRMMNDPFSTSAELNCCGGGGGNENNGNKKPNLDLFVLIGIGITCVTIALVILSSSFG